MVKLDEYVGIKKNIFPCECHDSHYIVVTRDDEEPDLNYIELTLEYNTTKLLEKLKAIWSILRGHEYINGGMVLNDENAKQLIEVLQGSYPKSEGDK